MIGYQSGQDGCTLPAGDFLKKKRAFWPYNNLLLAKLVRSRWLDIQARFFSIVMDGRRRSASSNLD